MTAPLNGPLDRRPTDRALVCAPASDETALRGFIARILGWSDECAQAIEHALGSVRLSTSQRAALVLLGETDLVPIAHALHRRTIGPERPFVVCDRRRLNMPASVRSPTNLESGVAAIQAARGGSLCIHRIRAPKDFPSLVPLVRDPVSSVHLIVCASARDALDPFLILPAPIRLPPLSARVSELPRIVDEYALDAISTLGEDAAGFTDADRTWVLDHSVGTLPEIEAATLRLVALRISLTVTGAAEMLGMSHVALSRWLLRRRAARR